MYTLADRPELISKDHYLLNIKIPGAKSVPGQFINIRVGNSSAPLLRRPFSIFSHDGDLVQIIVKVVGKGTEILSRMEAGDIDVIGPCGRGFSIVSNKKILITGGGVGNAPLYYLSRELLRNNNKLTYVYGSSSMEQVFCEEMFRKVTDSLVLVTDDGKSGTKGYATDIAGEILSREEFDFIYTCGPDVMMRKLSGIVNGRIKLEASLENYFGCGIGLCMGCTVPTESGFKKACVDGPVFESEEIIWGDLPS